LRKVTGFEFYVMGRSNMKHTFDKITLVCDTYKKNYLKSLIFTKTLTAQKKCRTRQLLVD
jgi:hypothetical protein